MLRRDGDENQRHCYLWHTGLETLDMMGGGGGGGRGVGVEGKIQFTICGYNYKRVVNHTII